MQRLPLYEGLADAILPTSRRETLRHALPAINALADAPAGTKLLWAESTSATYPVYAGEGRAALLVEPLPEPDPVPVPELGAESLSPRPGA